MYLESDVKDKEIQQTLDTIRKQILEEPNTQPDHSGDGVYLCKTEEGSCVQIIHGDVNMLMSHDFITLYLKMRGSK